MITLCTTSTGTDSIMIDKDKFLTIVDATPLVSIDLILEDNQGRILLGRRVNRPAQGYWFVPGGRIRKNELLAEAIKRISMTEFGTEIPLQDAQLIGAFDHIYDDNYHGVEQVNTHYVALGYKVTLTDTLEVAADEQHCEMKWWSKDSLISSQDVHANTKMYLAAP